MEMDAKRKDAMQRDVKQKGTKQKFRRPYITIAVFCVLIIGFTMATIITPSSEFSETENRVLAGMPEPRIDAILSGDFEADYEEYLTDQFVGRNQWIALKTSVERLLLKRESKDIYFAEDGYLIEKHTGVFQTQLAERNISVLTKFAAMYEGQFGAGRISVMVVPNAVDILQDKLPPFADSGGGNDFLEQITDSLPEGIWFDSASVLREHANEEIYYRTDHHWKTLAAFYVYRAWAEKQGYVVPEITAYEIQTVTDCFEGTVQSKLGIRTAGDTIELFYPIMEPKYTVYHEASIKEAELTEEETDIKEMEPVKEETATKKEEHSIDAERSGESGLYDYAALKTKDKYAVYFGGNEPFLQVGTETENGRKILVIKDSYANCFIPFMLGEFQEIDVLDLRYTNQKLSEMIAKGGYTDILVLYNAAGFAEDMSISKLIQ